MSESVPSKKEKSTEVVSRRRVLQTTGVVAGTGIGAALFGTTPAGAQQTLDFGEVAVGSSETQTVSQPNPTDQTLPITGVEITGSDADQFSVVDGGAPFTLQADESRTIAIEFAPTSTGQKSGSVQVEIAGGTTQTAGQLTGTGVSETAEQNGDDSTTDESTSSSQEVSTDESATATSDTPASEDVSSAGTETGDSPSLKDESAAEDSAAPPSDTDGSTSTEEDSPSIILMLDFNNNGVVDLQDIMTLIHMLG
ncbi:choice-of-anchor D domain-containing protein [Halalkalicoccus salilacus]|uniref:choice-of-anchor D domain-containing protein n=1 Tax=Halalkalicoccus TaxID=332246 RepID=UPI002F966D56